MRHDAYNGPCGQNTAQPQGAELEITVPSTVVGGDVRVAQITTTTDLQAYRVQYKYVEDIHPPSASSYALNSTGVLAKEPPFMHRFERPANDMFDYPTTPVIYGKVTVLRGKLTGDTDYDTREVYRFYTPTTDIVTETFPAWRYVNQPGAAYTNLRAVNNRTEVRTGLIGQPKEISTYNRRGQQELLTKLTYASEVLNPDNIAKQGQITEGVLNTEGGLGHFLKVNRSTKTYLPAVLSATESVRNGVSVRHENTLFDFYTGQVLETSFTNSLGEVYHSRTVPAYHKYPNMGPKGENAGNSHMLAQQTAAYTVKEKRGGALYDPLNFLNPAAGEVMAARVQTWQGNWANYRTPGPTGYADAADSPRPVWRERASYQWQSPWVTPNGSFRQFVDFTWAGLPNRYWLNAGQAVRYDHYSHLVEAKDVNNQYSAQKIGYRQSQQLASATNARFTELAYSGAEDVETDNATYFGGEVAIGGTPDATTAHTGRYSNRLDGAGDAFVYRARAGATVATGDLLTGRPYRLSVWVHPATGGAENAQLFATNGGANLALPAVTPVEKRKAGDWYRLSTNVTLPAGATDVAFGCRNAGGSVLYFDDFRLCPVNAAMTSRAYNPRNNNLTESLDNENLYTRFEYDAAGRLRRIYKETFDRPNEAVVTPRLVKEYQYNFANMRLPTWVTWAYRCETGSTGFEERRLVDINPLNANPLNNPPAATRWERNGPSADCVPPACEWTEAQPNMLYDTNNDGVLECVDATPEYLPCEGCTMTSPTRVGLQTVIRWTYPDHTTYIHRGECLDGCSPVLRQSPSAGGKKKVTRRPQPSAKTAAVASTKP